MNSNRKFNSLIKTICLIIGIFIFMGILSFFLILSEMSYSPPKCIYSVEYIGNSSDFTMYAPVPMDKGGHIPIEDVRYVDTIHGKMIEINTSEEGSTQYDFILSEDYLWFYEDVVLRKSPDVKDPVKNSFLLYPVYNITPVDSESWRYDSRVYMDIDEEHEVEIWWICFSEFSLIKGIMCGFGIGSCGNYEVIGGTNLITENGWVNVEMGVASEAK